MIASTARTGTRTGWQTTLADLALILFMVTAAAMAAKPPPEKAGPEKVGAEKAVETASPLPASGEPLAIYRVARGAPPLADWLRDQPRDTRQNLTIIARYSAGARDQSTAAANALAAEAGDFGRSARIVVEPAQVSELIAVLDFDGRQSGTRIAETGRQDR